MGCVQWRAEGLVKFGAINIIKLTTIATAANLERVEVGLHSF